MRADPPHLRSAAVGAALLAAALAGAPPAASQAEFREPPVVASRQGVLRDTLTFALFSHRVGMDTLRTATYDGLLPGPTWVVDPGDTLRFRLVNALAPPGSPPPAQQVVPCGDPALAKGRLVGAAHGEGPAHVATLTNLHTHGLQVSPVGNADNPFIDLEPGQSCDYEIRIPFDQPPGLFWYHPHRHGSTSKQGWAGAAGAIVVRGGLDTVAALRGLTTRTMVLQELWVDGAGRVPGGIPIPTAGTVFSSIGPEGAVPTEFLYTVNGVREPAIAARPGEVQRWRILNAAPHRFFVLRLQGHALWQIAQDGIALPEPRPVQTLLLAPGNRVEVLVRAGEAGSYPLVAIAADQGHPGGPLPEVALGTLAVAGAPAAGDIPARLPPMEDISGAPVARRRTVVFQGQILSAPVRFTLNDRVFDPAFMADSVTLGTVEEWTLVNRDVFQHPFHIHVNPFMVTEINGAPVEDPIWWDTFALPPRGTVKVRMFVRPDVAGATVYHCHILPHEDNGMMAAFLLAEPGGEP